MSAELTPSSDFFTDVRSILADARRATYTAVNSAMVAAYWQIGRRIVEEEQGGEAKAKYGDGLLKELSRALTAEFGKGFSLANLKNFRKFYLTFPDREKSYTLCSKLTWSHNRLIMREVRLEVREFYLRQSALENWSVRQLQRQIETRCYQRPLLPNQKSTISNPQSAINHPQSIPLIVPGPGMAARRRRTSLMSSTPAAPMAKRTCSTYPENPSSSRKIRLSTQPKKA